MLKTEERDIRGHKYIVSLFPAMQGYLLARQLISVFTDKDPVSKLCEIDKEGELILKLLENTARDDMAINKATFDKIYTGNLVEMVEALMFVFEVNFKDFLQGDVIGNLAKKAKKVTNKKKEG